MKLPQIFVNLLVFHILVFPKYKGNLIHIIEVILMFNICVTSFCNRSGCWIKLNLCNLLGYCSAADKSRICSMHHEM